MSSFSNKGGLLLAFNQFKSNEALIDPESILKQDVDEMRLMKFNRKIPSIVLTDEFLKSYIIKVLSINRAGILDQESEHWKLLFKELTNKIAILSLNQIRRNKILMLKLNKGLKLMNLFKNITFFVLNDVKKNDAYAKAILESININKVQNIVLFSVDSNKSTKKYSNFVSISPFIESLSNIFDQSNTQYLILAGFTINHAEIKKLYESKINHYLFFTSCIFETDDKTMMDIANDKIKQYEFSDCKFNILVKEKIMLIKLNTVLLSDSKSVLFTNCSFLSFVAESGMNYKDHLACNSYENPNVILHSINSE